MYQNTNDYFLAHYGVKGMKWGRRKAKDTVGSRINKVSKAIKSTSAEKKFETVKNGINSYLDKKERDNFFNSDSIFSEQSMKNKSRITRARDLINDLDYKTLTSKNGAKHLVDLGKKTVQGLLDDADERDFFNKDWDTRMKNRDTRDSIRKFIE